MKNLVKTAIISTLLSVSLLTIPIFYVGIEFIFLPIIIGLFIIGVASVITIPIFLIKHFKQKNQNQWLSILSGCAVGFYIAYFVMIPINTWDKKQRDISGKLLAASLEEYKERYGTYPENLQQMNLQDIDEKLPKTYQIDRFSYHLNNNEYHLDIPIPITDR